MKLLIEEILVADRQRSKITSQELTELKASIKLRGLLHAPVVSPDRDGGYRLIAGERRLRAIEGIYREGGHIIHNKIIYAEGEIPVTLLEDMPVSDLFATELEENVARQDLSWQDKAKAIARLAELQRLENPKITQMQIAEKLAEALPAPASGAPKHNIDGLRKTTRAAELVAKNLDRPEIAKARNFHEATQLVIKEEQARFEAEQVRRAKAKMALEMEQGPSGSVSVVHRGDCRELLATLDDGTFDLILSDPPYGLNADRQGFRGRSKEHHNYEDSPEVAEEILLKILSEGFRVTKPKANLFLFTDIDRFLYLRSAASRMGWTPWRTPIIWQKSQAEGLTPWGRHGPARTYEMIFFATKGQQGLRMPILDILMAKRVGRAERVHAAEKPVDLLENLIGASTMVGDSVLDPCAGSGSTLEAAINMKRKAVGIELEQRFVDIATVRLANKEEAIRMAQDLEQDSEEEDDHE